MKLKVEKREVLGKKVKSLRSEQIVPASVYGPGVEPRNVQVDAAEFRKIFQKVGFNEFFDIEIEGGKTSKVLVKEVQIHPVKDTFISISFYQVNENKKITVAVPVQIEGESPAVQLNLGFLVQQMDSINVHCLPKDLPHAIAVDISKLENVGDAITISEITLPSEVELSSDMDETSAIVYIGTAQKEEEEETPTEEGGEEEGEGAENVAVEENTEASE